MKNCAVRDPWSGSRNAELVYSVSEDGQKGCGWKRNVEVETNKVYISAMCTRDRFCC